MDYQFLQFATTDGKEKDEPAVITADAVIVGSGCGGGVAAKLLSEAGYKVVVVDKGYYFPPSHLPMAAEAGQQLLYEGEGALQATNGATSLLAGSCWGGGGTVNWSASLELQDFVRREWAAGGEGLEFFATQAFQDCIDRVSATMGVSDAHVRQNHGNRVLLEGAEKLGWHAKACPQNTGGNEHYCGRCSLGCGAGEKQGPAVNWLPAAQKAGARFIEGMRVDEVLFDEGDDGEEGEYSEEEVGIDGIGGKKRKAIGVVGQWTARDKDGLVHLPASERVQRTVRIEAKKVIVASGSLNSPLVLMRSGLKVSVLYLAEPMSSATSVLPEIVLTCSQNPHIGKNLHIHPCGFLSAAFPEDVQGWEGESSHVFIARIDSSARLTASG